LSITNYQKHPTKNCAQIFGLELASTFPGKWHLIQWCWLYQQA
jgi:hypothetical protein